MKKDRKVIYKAYLDLQKEENWINRMCGKGWALAKVNLLGIRFVFEPCQPGEYIYRSELVSGLGRKKRDYLAFLEDSGAEIIAHQWYNLGWTCCRKKSSDGPFELYSDSAGKLKQQKKLCKYYLFFGWLILALQALTLINHCLLYFHFGLSFSDSFIMNGFGYVNPFLSLLGIILICDGYRLRRKIRQMEKEVRIRE